jgi:hypothetical protein
LTSRRVGNRIFGFEIYTTTKSPVDRGGGKLVENLPNDKPFIHRGRKARLKKGAA